MKILFLLLLLAAPVSAHIAGEPTQAGEYTIELRTVPERLEPGQTTLVVSVTRFGQPVTDQEVWVRLSDRKKVYVAGTFVTDEAGTAAIGYYFNGPGTYTVTAEVAGNRAEIPLHVHGQYILLFGFLAAVFIGIALLFDNKGGPAKGFE